MGVEITDARVLPVEGDERDALVEVMEVAIVDAADVDSSSRDYAEAAYVALRDAAAAPSSVGVTSSDERADAHEEGMAHVADRVAEDRALAAEHGLVPSSDEPEGDDALTPFVATDAKSDAEFERVGDTVHRVLARLAPDLGAAVALVDAGRSLKIRYSPRPVPVGDAEPAAVNDEALRDLVAARLYRQKHRASFRDASPSRQALYRRKADAVMPLFARHHPVPPLPVSSQDAGADDLVHRVLDGAGAQGAHTDSVTNRISNLADQIRHLDTERKILEGQVSRDRQGIERLTLQRDVARRNAGMVSERAAQVVDDPPVLPSLVDLVLPAEGEKRADLIEVATRAVSDQAWECVPDRDRFAIQERAVRAYDALRAAAGKAGSDDAG